MRKFSTSTSAARVSRVSVCCPSSLFRSRAMDSLFRLQDRKYVDCLSSAGPTKGGPQRRVSSAHRAPRLDDPSTEVADISAGWAGQRAGEIDDDNSVQ